MATKKTAAAGPGKIQCPACQSLISISTNGGSTLHARSAYLEGLLETDAGVDDLDKQILETEKRLADAKKEIEQLKAALAEANKKPEVRKDVGTKGTGSETKQPGGNWWDW